MRNNLNFDQRRMFGCLHDWKNLKVLENILQRICKLPFLFSARYFFEEQKEKDVLGKTDFIRIVFKFAVRVLFTS